ACLDRRRPERLRCAAAAALPRLVEHHPDQRTAAREAIEELLREGGFRTSLSALDALAELGDPDALPAIARSRESAADGRVRRMAYEAAVRLRRRDEARLTELHDRADALAREQAR